MAVTFVRTTPFPICKYCGVRMEYYILGLPDDEHSHSECEGRHRANESLKLLDTMVKEGC